MKLFELSLENYRCHRKVMSIPFSDITTIVGENDSGKTSALDAVSLLLENVKPSEGDYYKCYENDCEEKSSKITITGKFKLDENEISIFEGFVQDECFIIIRKVFTETSDEFQILGQKFVEDRLGKYETFKATDLKKLLEDLGLPKEANQDLRKSAIKNYIETVKPDRTEEWIAKKFSEIKEYLPKMVRYGVNDYNDPSKMIYKTLKLIFESELYEVNEKTGKKELKSTELKDFLGTVNDKIDESIKKLSVFSKKFVPSINELTVEAEYDLSSGLRETPIRIKDESGVSHYLENRGFGTQKRMFMAIMDWTSEVSKISNIIRCYDEPDNSLHIEAQRNLFKTIQGFVKSNESSQAIICTHSLFMIDSVPIDSIRLISRTKTGFSSVDYIKSVGDAEVEKFMKTMCREMGLANSHIFFEKAFIIVEGPTELNYLPLAYRKKYDSTLSGDGITLINLQGNGAAINFIKLLMTNKFDLCYLFLDNDSTHVRKEKMIKSFNTSNDRMTKDKYEELVEKFFSERVFFIGDKEFEDSFTNQTITRCLNDCKPKESGMWVEIEIENLRNDGKFSDQLTKLVYETTKDGISKPELGTHLGNTSMAVDIPNEVIELFEKIRMDLNL